MSKWIVDIHGDIEGDYEIIKKYEEPKTGHWTEHPHEWGDDWQYSDYECSICHNWTHFEHDYCPNCGAKMAETEAEE